MARTKTIRHPSLSDKIYETLKNQIINEELKPGERLLDDKLASTFGVSRTPVREALTRLAGEGLVEIVPRSGVYVKKLTAEEVEEIYEVRKALESLAARKAAQLIPARQIKQLISLLERTKDLVEKGDVEAHIELDIKLHDLVIKYCGNRTLASIMKKLYTLIHVFRVRVGKSKDIARRATKEHAAIIEALREKDPDKAEEAMKEHIEKSKSYIYVTKVLDWSTQKEG